ncbi:MAG: ABC transporter ATP-binding protein/permease [Coriobacteriales bacterium]|jgi:ATP-binding cassette subfamily C protein CydD
MGSMFSKEILALPGARRALAAMLACSLADAVGAVAQAWALAGALASLWEGATLASQAPALLAFLAAFAARQLVGCLRSRVAGRFAEDRCARMRSDLLGDVLEAGGGAVGAFGTGTVVTTLLEGVEQVRSYIALMLPKVADLAVVPLVIVIALFLVDWVSGLIALCVLPFTIWYMTLIGSQAKARAERQHAEYDALSSHFVDSLRGIDTLTLFGQAHQQGERVYAVSERFRKATVATLRMATVSSLVLDLFATFGLAAVAIMLGFRLMGGTVALAPALTALILVPEYFAPVRRFASDFHASLDGKTALARIIEMGAELHGRSPGTDAAGGEAGGVAESPANAAGARRGGAGTAPLPVANGAGTTVPDVPAADGARGGEAGRTGTGGRLPAWGDGCSLELRGVTYLHGGEREAGGADRRGRGDGQGDRDRPGGVRDVSLELRGNQVVALVGQSGAGKSTLLDVLAGFVSPEAGSIELRAPGVPARRIPTLRRPDWLSQVAYIPQDPHVFSASLRDNVRFYRPDATDAQVRDAVAAVGLDELVAELPEGLDSRVGEGARRLSGGQAQRIALARAIVADRRVLLLDEPTAHLDIETELELKRHMLPTMRGRLTVIATHRLHWVGDADVVAVLEAGRVAQVGSPEELARDRDGAYARLARALGGGDAR